MARERGALGRLDRKVAAGREHTTPCWTSCGTGFRAGGCECQCHKGDLEAKP